MNQVARKEPEVVPVPQAETVAFVQMIERAARDPNVDVDKMERLLAMQERVIERNARAAYAGALAQMQPNLPVITQRGQIKVGEQVRSTYAKWEDINEAIRPLLAEHGFALSFRTGQQDGKIIVTGVLSHRDGHSEETTMHLPLDTSGSKNNVQAAGSSTSYGKRYTACALLNITSRGEDDDGRSAVAPDAISQKQADEIRDALEANGKNVKSFLKWAKVDRIEDLRADFYESALTAIKARAQS